jgi:hypothetical protein
VAGRLGVCAAAVFLLFAEPAGAGWRWDATRSRRGLDAAVSAHRLAPLDALVYRRDLQAATTALTLRPSGELASALDDAAELSAAYDGPRALALFSTLRVNARMRGGSGSRDVRDADGIVYRWFPGRGFRFHPLASFAALNADAAAGRYRQAVRLAYALIARARPAGGGLVWESYFPWPGGRPPWTSGLTQAVAAQAFARAGFRGEARLAYLGLARGLLRSTSGGPWVKLYSSWDAAVLNAQLQAALSLQEYGRRTGDAAATRLAARLRRSAATLLPRFDTSFWTRYALDGQEAPLSYHRYVVELLWKLSRRTHERSWSRWAARFRAYWRKPPELRPLRSERAVYPVPADGFRDRARIRFWLSKPAKVTVRVGGSVRALFLQPGRRQLWWSPGRRAAGGYPVRLSAVDRVGNRGARSLSPVVVRRDRSTPGVRASAAGGRLRWHAHDDATPWLSLHVVLFRGAERRRIDLGRRPLRGSARLPFPGRGWHAILVASDSSGNGRLLSLGR